jgi:hypothetical protein
VKPLTDRVEKISKKNISGETETRYLRSTKLRQWRVAGEVGLNSRCTHAPSRMTVQWSVSIRGPGVGAPSSRIGRGGTYPGSHAPKPAADRKRRLHRACSALPVHPRGELVRHKFGINGRVFASGPSHYT